MKISDKSEKYFPYEIQVSRKAWDKLGLDSVARRLRNRSGMPDIIFYRHLAGRLNMEPETQGKPVKAGNVNLYALLTRIYRYLMNQYTMTITPGIFEKILDEEGYDYHFGDLHASLKGFVEYFPGSRVIEKTGTAHDYVSAEDPGDRRKKMVISEFLLLRLSCQNPALNEFRGLFDDTGLVADRRKKRFFTLRVSSPASYPQSHPARSSRPAARSYR